MNLRATVYIAVALSLAFITTALSNQSKELVVKNAHGISAFSSDGKTFFSEAWKNDNTDAPVKIDVREAKTGTLVRQINAPKTAEFLGQVGSVLLLPDNGDLIMRGGEAKPYGNFGVLRIDSKTGENRWSWLLKPYGFAPLFALSPDGKYVAMAYTDGGQLDLIDATTGQTITTTKLEYTQGASSIAFTPDSEQLAFGSNLGVRMLDVPSLNMLRWHRVGNPHSISFSSDGKTMAIGFRLRTSDRARPGLYDWRTGDLLQRLYGQKYFVTATAFSPDGRWVVTGGGSEDITGVLGTLWMWDVQTGKKLREFKGWAVQGGVAFSPDGSRLIYGGKDNTLHIWTLK